MSREQLHFATHPDDHVCYEYFTAWFQFLDAQGALTMSTVADLKTSVDNLAAAVAKVSAEVAALKAVPHVVQNVEQADLDATVTAVDAATASLTAL
jgi:hypothetical protein